MAVSSRSAIGKENVAYPGSSEDVPFVHLEVLSKPLYVFDEVPGGVTLEVGGPLVLNVNTGRNAE